MLSFRKFLTGSWSVWTVALLVLLLKTWWVFHTSIRGLASTTWLIDDSFIEMKVAMNLGQGHGFSLDGIHPTTGAPFFWIYLTSLNHILFSADLAIRMTLVETAVLGMLATLVVFFLALKVTADRRVAWTAFLLSTLTANAFFNALNGMDTALFTLFVLLTFATAFDVGRPARWSGFAWGCVIGLFAGLAMMTRGDGIFVFFALLCVQAWGWLKADAAGRKEYLRTLIGILLFAGACFAFFMGWQLLQTGSPLPGNQVGRRALAYAFHHFSFDDFSLSRYLRIVVWNVFQLDELLTVAMGSSMLALAALVVGCCRREMRTFGIMTAIYLAVFFALLVGYQWYFANLHGLRYINPAAHLLFIFIAALLWQLPVHFGKKTAAVLIALSLGVLATYRHYQMISRLPWAKYMSYVGTPDPEPNEYFWSTIDWMKEHLPDGTIVGVRDYGRAALFTNVRVQDIAGNIDPNVLTTLKDGTLNAYLKELNVEYLLIPSLELRTDDLYQYLHKNLKLQLVKDAPKSPTQYLYKIIW